MKHLNAATQLIPFPESRNDHPTNGLARPLQLTPEVTIVFPIA
jgi:hypothetical protein